MTFYLFSFFVSAAMASTLVASPHASFDLSHAEWTKILKTHIENQKSPPRFNYAALKKSPTALQNYVDSLRTVERATYLTWSEPEKLSFLINAYNAFTIKIIADSYPVKSIKEVGGLFSNPWKKKFFSLFSEPMSLDLVEKEIFKTTQDPRVHFALFRGSLASPPLRSEAYVGRNLTQQLESQTKATLASSAFVEFEESQKTIKLSRLFKWHENDFKKSESSLLDFIYPYLSGNHPRLEDLKTFKIQYQEFSWALNDL